MDLSVGASVGAYARLTEPVCWVVGDDALSLAPRKEASDPGASAADGVVGWVSVQAEPDDVCLRELARVVLLRDPEHLHDRVVVGPFGAFGPVSLYELLYE